MTFKGLDQQGRYPAEAATEVGQEDEADTWHPLMLRDLIWIAVWAVISLVCWFYLVGLL